MLERPIAGEGGVVTVTVILNIISVYFPVTAVTVRFPGL